MREAETYRGARRNACRDERRVWGPVDLFKGHPASYRTMPREYRGVRLSRKPSKYHPLEAARDFLHSIGKGWIGAKKTVTP